MNGPGWKPAVEPMFRIRPLLRATMRGRNSPVSVSDRGDVHLHLAQLAREVRAANAPLVPKPALLTRNSIAIARAASVVEDPPRRPGVGEIGGDHAARRRRARREAAPPAPRARRGGAPPAPGRGRRRRTASPAPSPAPTTPRSPAPFFPIPVSPSAGILTRKCQAPLRYARSARWPSAPRGARRGRHAGRGPRARRAALGRRRAGGRALRLRGPRQGGALVGFEVDSRNALAQALGVRARFVQNDWSNLIPSLERGTFDIALNGVEVTPARAPRVAFTRPTTCSASGWWPARGDARVRDLASLRGLRVGTLANSQAWDSGPGRRRRRRPLRGVDEPFVDLEARPHRRRAARRHHRRALRRAARGARGRR